SATVEAHLTSPRYPSLGPKSTSSDTDLHERQRQCEWAEVRYCLHAYRRARRYVRDSGLRVRNQPRGSLSERFALSPVQLERQREPCHVPGPPAAQDRSEWVYRRPAWTRKMA